ncbi:hypothetical protein BDZ94DRAFT_1297703 [Collybia nuda]|uniref:Uncharacterized protein n=1 Tax=Collybia nuda TaxID=64659 RepID=A0A9P5Y9D0_9AGAR|nr:hypothetical protein BDZ94DRAFT_1297703 [Collybia nuda]
MHFSLIVTVAAAIAFANIQALEYRGYSSSTSCDGDSFSFNDDGALCSSLPTGFGLSVQFFGLPSGTQGQGYVEGGCTEFLFSVFGPGNKCWNGGGTPATHANWFHSPNGFGARGVDANVKNGTEKCNHPISFSYTDLNEQTKEVLIDATIEDHAEKIAALYAKKDYAGLAAL